MAIIYNKNIIIIMTSEQNEPRTTNAEFALVYISSQGRSNGPKGAGQSISARAAGARFFQTLILSGIKALDIKKIENPIFTKICLFH